MKRFLAGLVARELVADQLDVEEAAAAVAEQVALLLEESSVAENVVKAM